MQQMLNVVVGKIRDAYSIESQGNIYEVKDWKTKAAWQLLRFLYGYRKADLMIEERKDWLKENNMDDVSAAVDLLKELSLVKRKLAIQKEPLQFILDGKTVVAVATIKHLIVPPSEVYSRAAKIMEQINLQIMEEIPSAFGVVFKIEESYGFQKGVQVYAGDILTNRAIKVCSFLRVVSCFNPLSWLDIGSFARFLGYPHGWERVVRIEALTDLESRLHKAINFQLEKLPEIEKLINASRDIQLSKENAIVLLVSFGSSYGFGIRTLQQVYQQYQSEDQSLLGLANAFSYIAVHGKTRATPEGMQNLAIKKLSTIAAACLLSSEAFADTLDRSKEWLQSKIKQGKLKTLEEIQQELASQ